MAESNGFLYIRDARHDLTRVISRSCKLEQAMDAKKAEDHEMAQYRREIMQEASQQQREQARQDRVARAEAVRRHRQALRARAKLAQEAEEEEAKKRAEQLECERREREHVADEETDHVGAYVNKMLMERRSTGTQGSSTESSPRNRFTGAARRATLIVKTMSSLSQATSEAMSRHEGMDDLSEDSEDEQDEELNVVDLHCKDQRPKKSFLAKITRKKSCVERFQALNELKRSRRQEMRLLRLLELRRAQFDELPEEERSALHKAYCSADPLHSGRLDTKQFRQALKYLGIRAKTESEKREVHAICNEYLATGPCAIERQLSVDVVVIHTTRHWRG